MGIDLQCPLMLCARNSIGRTSLTSVFLSMAILAGAKELPLIKIENGIRATEPGWNCRSAILNRPPTPVLSERPVLVNSCEHASGTGKREWVDVKVFEVASRADAVLSFSSVREQKVAAGWAVKTFNLGDEGYLSTYRNGVQFEMHFRKGLIVAQPDSDSLELVTRFAHYVAAHLTIDPNPPQHTYKVGEEVISTDLIGSFPDAQYTEAAKNAGIKGTVRLSALVGIDGCARDIRVLSSLGYGLDESAVDAVKRWRWRTERIDFPKTPDGKAQPVRVIAIEVNFDPRWSSVAALTAEPCLKP